MVKPKPVIEPNAVYSREEAAEILGVSLSTVKRMIAKGHLQVSRLNGGRRLFIRGANILTMLDQATVQNQTLGKPAPSQAPHSLRSGTSQDKIRAEDLTPALTLNEVKGKRKGKGQAKGRSEH